MTEQDLNSEYSAAMAAGIIFPEDAVAEAVESGDMTALANLLGPVLLTTTAKSALWHLRSEDMNDRRLGTNQVKVVMPFITPKLEQVTVKEGAVAPNIVEYMKKIKHLPPGE